MLHLGPVFLLLRQIGEGCFKTTDADERSGFVGMYGDDAAGVASSNGIRSDGASALSDHRRDTFPGGGDYDQCGLYVSVWNGYSEIVDYQMVELGLFISSENRQRLCKVWAFCAVFRQIVTFFGKLVERKLVPKKMFMGLFFSLLLAKDRILPFKLQK